MEWQDDGIVLSVRHHGESARIATVLTRGHGRHAGLLRGNGAGKGGAVQPGQLVRVDWRGRLSEHLGYFSLESVGHPASLMLDDRARLAALACVCALTDTALPEREPHPNLFEATRILLFHMPDLPEPQAWGALYVRWETGLLAEMGYGIDLESCAATGDTIGLSHVSPRSGRAVSAAAAAPYADRLLPLPGFLVPGRGMSGDPLGDVLAGLALTGHFLEHRLFAQLHAPMPAARFRLVEAIHGTVAKTGVENPP